VHRFQRPARVAAPVPPDPGAVPARSRRRTGARTSQARRSGPRMPGVQRDVAGKLVLSPRTVPARGPPRRWALDPRRPADRSRIQGPFSPDPAGRRCR
jgi:hypothetical protein